MKILVTGGAGYIGSVTVALLLAKGHEVIVYDSLEKGHRGAVAPGARLVTGDLSDREAVERVLTGNGIEAVIHFAAYSLVGESIRRPGDYFVNNISNGLVLLEAMRAAGTGRIIFSSSAAVYGSPRSGLIDETHPTSPINPYGESKLFFEKVLHRFRRAYGLDYVSLRYFNAAGASPDFGEDHCPETHLIPLVLGAALAEGGSVKVFGDDYETDDGSCVRDYIHVEDLAEAHILALGRDGGQIYNLGNGRGFSVKQVIESAGRITGKRIEAEQAPRREGDPAVLVASSDRIRAELGWKPRFPGLEEIIGSAWEWMRNNPEGYKE